MTDFRRAENTCLLSWRLRPLSAAILALSATPLWAAAQAPGFGQDSISGLPVYAAEEAANPPAAAPVQPQPVASEPSVSPRANASLPNLDTAGERLGWLSRADIAQLPALDRPPIDATCEGAWVTPIGPSVPAGKLDESEAQYRQNITRWPNNEVSACGLADVLKARGELPESEAQYRQNITR